MSGKREIRLLDDTVINQIAAGEVVERPASVVKELVENAIDAGARSVEVEVQDGGKKLVAVRDDGCGMDEASALQSLDRHATSKLREISDLDQLETMGFRGEALPSIASVSQFTMTTSEGGEEGTEVVVFGGRVQSVRSVGAPKGTEIAVRNLFYNLPVRSRNLRGASTEYLHVRQAFILEALSNLGTSFTLKADGAVALRLPAVGNLLERVRDIYGREVAEHVRAMESGNGVVEVTGLAGIPPFSRTDTDWQIVMVNGRPATSGPINYGIKTAYRDLLNAGRYAPVFLEIRLPADQVDVNIHPAKKEVRFHRPVEVRELVVEAIRGAVAGPGPRPLPQVERRVEARREERGAEGGEAGGAAGGGEEKFRLVEPIQGELELPVRRGFPTESGGSVEAEGAGRPVEAEGEESWRKSPWAQYRILGRVCGGVVVMETEEGLVLMDARSAHERVLYERLLKQMERRKPESQGLLTPVVVEFSPAHHLAMTRHLKDLNQLGFGLEEFGDFSLKVEAVPAALAGEDITGLMQEIAAGVMQGGRATVKDWLKPLVAERAGHFAVAARQTLEDREVDELVKELGRTEMPYTSPRGKPTVILMSRQELKRKFGRE